MRRPSISVVFAAFSCVLFPTQIAASTGAAEAATFISTGSCPNYYNYSPQTNPLVTYSWYVGTSNPTTAFDLGCNGNSHPHHVRRPYFSLQLLKK